MLCPHGGSSMYKDENGLAANRVLRMGREWDGGRPPLNIPPLSGSAARGGLRDAKDAKPRPDMTGRQRKTGHQSHQPWRQEGHSWDGGTAGFTITDTSGEGAGQGACPGRCEPFIPQVNLT